jgi:hypothetical protein
MALRAEISPAGLRDCGEVRPAIEIDGLEVFIGWSDPILEADSAES